MIGDFLYLPWAQVAAMFGAFIGAITFFSLIAARIPRFAKWVGRPVKDALGMTEILIILKDHIADMHAHRPVD